MVYKLFLAQHFHHVSPRDQTYITTLTREHHYPLGRFASSSTFIFYFIFIEDIIHFCLQLHRGKSPLWWLLNGALCCKKYGFVLLSKDSWLCSSFSTPTLLPVSSFSSLDIIYILLSLIFYSLVVVPPLSLPTDSSSSPVSKRISPTPLSPLQASPLPGTLLTDRTHLTLWMSNCPYLSTRRLVWIEEVVTS